MHQIYVALLDEGVDVWRPVQAEDLGNGVFRLVGPIPEGEVWAYQPADTIRCSEKLFADGRKGMVATALVNADA